MPKILSCYDVSPMDNCGFAVQGETVQEVMEHGGMHSTSRHGLKEEDATPEMMSVLRSRVREVPARVPPPFPVVPRATPSLVCCSEASGEECLFAVQSDEPEELIEQLRDHMVTYHGETDEGRILERLVVARGLIRASGGTVR